MITFLAITGGGLAVGLSAYAYLTNRTRSLRQPVVRRPATDNSQGCAPPARPVTKPFEPTSQTTASITLEEAAIRHGLRASSISLGVATTGLLIFPPLHHAALPVLIYMGIPPAQDAYHQLRSDGRAGTSLAETAILTVFLAGGYVWIGSLGFSLYFLGRALHHKRVSPSLSDRFAWQTPKTARLSNDSSEIHVPVETLQRGDRIVVETGEIVPVDGLIVEGTATTKPAALTRESASTHKMKGDTLSASEIILVGRVQMRVQ